MPLLPSLRLTWTDRAPFRIQLRKGLTRDVVAQQRHYLSVDLDEAVKLIFLLDVGWARWQT